MSKAICFKEFGGPEVLRWMDVDIPEPGPGEMRIRHQAIGVNKNHCGKKSRKYAFIRKK